MADINEELRVLVTAEVDKAIKNLKSVDKQTDTTEKMFKQLGGAIGAAFSVKAVVDFGRACADQYRENNQAASILKSTLESTGATAWTTFKDLENMASGLQQKTNFAASSIESMQSVLLGFRNIKGDTFEEATKAILDMATVMKMDLSSAAQSVGKALDDPIHGIDSLKKQGFNFTAAQKKVIQSLLDTGDAAGAQKIILDELNGTFGGAAEAAADSATQIKNAWDDLKSAVGEGLVDTFNALNGKTEGNAIAEYLEGTAEAFRQSGKEMQRMKDYSSFWDSLTDDEKLEEARYQIKQYEKQVELSTDAINKAWSESQKKSFEKGRENHQKKIEQWKEVEQSLLKSINLEQELQTEENNRADAEAAINNLMLEISRNYEKLGKDDPTIQLKNYQKELEDIKKKREELKKSALDSDGNIIDTSEALTQLDYVEKKIREKIKALKDDGKKTWKEFWEDATGVSADSFKTGKQAGELYINGLKQSLEDDRELAKLLGNDFDFAGAIEDQMSEIESVITQLLNIPADKINEVYSTADASVQKLIDYYKKLNDQKKAFEADDMIKDLEDEYAKLLMTDKEIIKAEQDAVIAKLEVLGADEKQIENARKLLNLIQEQKEARKGDEDSIENWSSFLEEKISDVVKKMNLFKKNVDESNKAIVDLGTGLAGLAGGSSVTFLKELGSALGEGKNASESMQNALEAMAQEILNQLPLLFMQAGLQLIAQGQWAIGLGLMAAGLSTSVVSGFVNGRSKSAETNALGGVYGDDSYSAFAKGGTFTNQIVARPTYFRFAKGSGFGTGLMGEAGPEAIMPLTRGADGSLGVSASGIGGGDVQVNVPVTVYSDEPVEVHDTEDENGQRKIEILVGSMINQHIAGGKADRALKSRYGLKVQGV